MESYYDLKKMLCKELDMIMQESRGELSKSDLDTIDKLTHSIKSLVTIMAMEDSGYSYDGGYSGVRRHDSMGRYADYDDGYSGRRYYDGRRYSRDDGKSHMIHQFEKMMEESSSPEEHEVLQSAINRLRNM